MKKLRITTVAVFLLLPVVAFAKTIGPWPGYLNFTGYAWEDQPIPNYTSGPVYIEAPDVMRMPAPNAVAKNATWLPYGTYWGSSQWQERLACARLLGIGDWTDPENPIVTPLQSEPTVIHAKIFDPHDSGKQGWAVVIFDDTGKVLDFGIRPFDATKKVRAMQYDGSNWTASRWVAVRPASKSGRDDYYTIDLMKNPDGTFTWSMMAYETLDDYSHQTWWFTGKTTVAYGSVKDGIYLETSMADSSYATNYKWTEFALSFAPPVSVVRGLGDGTQVTCYGIVTKVENDFFYIEAPDRSVGIRVNSAGVLPMDGDLVEVTGTIGYQKGEKVINATAAPVVISGDVDFPARLDLRARDVGGASHGPNDPGITDGRGALNVGLRIGLCGVVTAVDPSYSQQWFYVWDGSNRGIEPLNDGTGNIGVRVLSTMGFEPGDWVDIDGIVTADDTIVPGRVIPVILPRAIEFVTSFDTITDAVPWASIYPGSSGVKGGVYNLIGLPAMPKVYDPMTVFSPYAVDMGNLWRFDTLLSSFIAYDPWAGDFGGMFAGEGYWLYADSDWDVSFEGKVRSYDQWVSLPVGGGAYNVIGHPFDHNTFLTDVKVHNGAEIKTMEEAVNAGWLTSSWWWMDNDTGSWTTIDFPMNFPPSCKLAVWHGYYVRTYVPNLSLIIPASPNAGADIWEVPF